MANEPGRVVERDDLPLHGPHAELGRRAGDSSAPGARRQDDRARLDDAVIPRADPGHAIPCPDQRLDGLADQIAHAPSLTGADERAHELDVVDPRAAGDEERAQRRRADGGLETPQLVLPDDGHARLARAGIAGHALGVSSFVAGHAEPEVAGASQPDVDPALLAERVGQRIVEISAQSGEDSHGVAPCRIGERQDAGGGARGLRRGLRSLDDRDPEPGLRQLVGAGGADRARSDDDGVGPAQPMRRGVMGPVEDTINPESRTRSDGGAGRCGPPCTRRGRPPPRGASPPP